MRDKRSWGELRTAARLCWLAHASPDAPRGMSGTRPVPQDCLPCLTERVGELGTGSVARMAPRNAIRGAKTQAIARPAARRPTSPACRNPAKTRGAYRFSLRAKNRLEVYSNLLRRHVRQHFLGIGSLAEVGHFQGGFKFSLRVCSPSKLVIRGSQVVKGIRILWILGD